MPAARVMSLAIALALVAGLEPATAGMPGARSSTAMARSPTLAAAATSGPGSRRGLDGADRAVLPGASQAGPPPTGSPTGPSTATRQLVQELGPAFAADAPREPVPEPPITAEADGVASPDAGSPAQPLPAEAPATVLADPAGCAPPPDGLAPAPVIRSGARAGRTIALTFDDGYDPDNTLRILRILRSSGVNATFFPLGLAILASPATWRAVVAAGYPIADHTYDHARLTGRCYQTQLAELTKWQSSVRRVLGVASLPLMRPPGGAFDRTTRLAASGAGEVAVVLWDVDTRDWSGLSARTIASRALDGGAGSIVLMHTQPGNTAAALPSIIAGYRARGFSFVTVGTMLGLGGPVPFG